MNILNFPTGGISFYIDGKEINSAMCGGFIDDDAYTEVLDNTILVNIDVVLVNRKQRLFYLIRRTEEPLQDNWWWFGGRRNKGETSIDGIRRSFEKEAGFFITPDDRFEFVAIIEYIWQKRQQEIQNKGSHHIAHQFILELTPDEIEMVQQKLTKSNKSGYGLEVFDRERIISEDLHPAVLEVYDKVFRSWWRRVLIALLTRL